MQSALVIDDDPLFRIIAEETLRAIGFKSVDLADDGAAGLQQLRARNGGVDLVMCDLNMPNMDGVSVIRELGQIDFNGALIIASSEDLSLISSVRTMAQLVGVRVLGALKKPLDENALTAMLQNQASQARRKSELVTRHMLKSALGEDLIQPWYQPKLDSRLGRVTGVEALLRVTAPNGETLSPEPFIFAAERDRLIGEVTNRIVEKVVADLGTWSKAGFDLDVSINISPVSLDDLDLPDRIRAMFLAGGIDPRRTTLEITENRFLNHDANVLDILSRMRLAGFRLSMDDFGTGATSMEQLRLFPFNELKIDKSFVLAACDDEFSRTTVETGARLAAMLGLDVVAEGVETPEALKLVTQAGAGFIQGYLIARPMPGDALVGWMRTCAVKAVAAAA